MNKAKITKDDLKWIDKVIDNHKMIRKESTRDRVKLLMMASMWKIIERINK